MRLSPSATLTLALLLSAPAYAQDTTARDGEDDFHTDQAIVVTAPYVRSLDILGNISVLEGEKLAQDIRGQIGDSLTSQPGVSATRSEEHTSELQSLMRISYAVFCLKKKKKKNKQSNNNTEHTN